MFNTEWAFTSSTSLSNWSEFLTLIVILGAVVYAYWAFVSRAFPNSSQATCELGILQGTDKVHSNRKRWTKRLALIPTWLQSLGALHRSQLQELGPSMSTGSAGWTAHLLIFLDNNICHSLFAVADGGMLSNFDALPQLLLIRTEWGRYYSNHHFTSGATEAQKG